MVSYFKMFIGAVVLGFLAYMKYLRATNEEQEENIARLKKEIVVRKEVAKDEVKRAVFDAKQKERYEVLKQNEITLDEIEEEVKSNEDSSNMASDDFFVRRV